MRVGKPNGLDTMLRDMVEVRVARHAWACLREFDGLCGVIFDTRYEVTAAVEHARR